MRVQIALVTVLSMLVCISAQAHEGELGPNGGQIVEDASHHVEFIANADQVVLFVSDAADAVHPTTGATGRVIVQDGAAQAIADLSATEPNQMVAKLAKPLSPGAKLVVSLKLADGHDVKARFVAK